MIPITEPGNLPLILFLMVTLGIPVGILADLLWFFISRIPSRQAQLFLPALCALAFLIFTVVFFGGPVTPESYQRTWVFMMITGFLTSAFLILASFPFLRRHIRNVSPFAVIFLATLVAFFVLASAGIIGGDARIPPQTDFQRILSIVIPAAGESAVAALVYGILALAGSGRGGDRTASR